MFLDSSAQPLTIIFRELLIQTWINGGGKTQAVNLSTNSDKSYLRIRIRSRNEEESENDGSKMNQRDIKFKVRHIAKIGSEAETAPDNRRTTDSKKSQNKYFVIRMKYTVGEYNKFKFLAQSPAERDSVLLAIRSLLDQGKHAQQRSLPSKSHTNEYETRATHQANVKSFKALHIHDRRNEMHEEDTDSFGIPAPRGMANPIENGRFPSDSRDDNGFRRPEDSKRDAPEGFARDSYPRENGLGKAYDSSYTLTAPSRISTTTRSNRNKPTTWMEKKQVDSSGNRQHQNVSNVNYHNQRTRTVNKVLENEDMDRPKSLMDRPMSSMSESTNPSGHSEQSFARDPIGRHPEDISALAGGGIANLADGGIANLAADFTNPAIGPWCTDDICTASLKDFADSMTGIFDLKDRHDLKGIYAANQNQRAAAEEYISGFLGDKSNMSELLSVKDLWNVAAMKHATGKEVKKMRLQNRARKPSGKAERLMSLRKQMTFRGATTTNMCVQTISSFDDANRKAKEDTDDCEQYYDSDPEDAREHTLTRGPRVVMARRAEASSELKAKRREALDILDTSRFGLGRKWKRLGHDVLSDIIEATKNERLTLIWHPTQNKENSNMAPVCVKVWVESGVYLTDGSFLLPKLTWLPAHEKKLENRELNVSDKNPGSLELLDVCRVRECQSIDRSLHPFARVDKSFIIQTQNGRFLFEAQTKQERGRVVNGLKLVIARLASLLMLKDLRAVDEFFGGNAVPGEAPVWARGYEKDESTVDFP